jgi:hypothetical protein
MVLSLIVSLLGLNKINAPIVGVILLHLKQLIVAERFDHIRPAIVICIKRDLDLRFGHGVNPFVNVAISVCV